MLDASHTVLLTSATFHSAANLLATRPDVVITSSDGVAFHVHLQNLVSSHNGFQGALNVDVKHIPSGEHPLALRLAIDSQVLNIILHTLYGMSCEAYQPTLAQMILAIAFLKLYDCPIMQYLALGAPLYVSFLAQSPLRPIEAFTVAAENSLEDLACAISPHLLSYHLAKCPDEYAARMGGVYFKRMHALQDERITSLRDMVLVPPFPHGPTKACDFSDQKALNRAWAMASAQLCWDARPGEQHSALVSRVLILPSHWRPLAECYRARPGIAGLPSALHRVQDGTGYAREGYRGPMVHARGAPP